ncbi:MAG: hypothetical protein KDA42_06225, partial [Planctomycetales bacterium]|nr:hypothetical protein [Planctomycetales bacterium]
YLDQLTMRRNMNRNLTLAVVFSFLFTTLELHADEASAIQEIEKLGGAVRPIAAKSEQREVAFHLGGTDLTDAGLVHLPQVSHVVWLNLRDTKISDAGLAEVGKLAELTRLHLERTAIGDAGMQHLKGLAKLEYLNLYGTKITDAGLAPLKELKGLKKLYVWQTSVSEAGAADLAQAVPGLEVIRGVDLAPAKPKEEEPTPENAQAKLPAKGQFVRVRLEGDGKILSLAEVEIKEKGNDKPIQSAGEASQSSVASGGEAKRGNDGNTAQVYAENSVTHTNNEKDPWWMVDLKGIKEIVALKIYNRQEVGDRLSGAIVEILDAEKKVVWTAKIDQASDGSAHELGK